MQHSIAKALFIILFCGIHFIACPQNHEFRFSKLDISNGLSKNEISAIARDSDGFLWFGTTYGLNRYDGAQFKVFLHNNQDPYSLADNYIHHIVPDSEGHLWVNHRNGYSIYNPETENFYSHIDAFFAERDVEPIIPEYVFAGNDGKLYFVASGRAMLYQFNPEENNLRRIHSVNRHTGDNPAGVPSITHVAQCVYGKIWVVFTDGLLLSVDADTDTLLLSASILKNRLENQMLEHRLFAATDGSLWIHPLDVSQGIFRYDQVTDELMHIHTGSYPLRLNNNTISNVVQDDAGRIWIGTDHGGINLVDMNSLSVQYIMHQPSDPFSLAQNAITTVFKDHEGIIWIGTHKNGVSYYHPKMIRFPLFTERPGVEGGLPFSDINCFEEDHEGNIWIGTNGGGLVYFNPKELTFTTYRHSPHDPYSLSSDVVVSLLIDHRGQLWAGTYLGGLNRYLGNGRFAHYKHDPQDPHSIPDNKVWALLQDKQNSLWTGTLGGHLTTLDTESGKFLLPDVFSENHPPFDAVHVIKQDATGNFWVGTSNGLFRIQMGQRKYQHLCFDAKDPLSLSSDIVNAVYIDSQNRVWAGTMNGLNIFGPEENQYRILSRTDGLPDNVIRAITQDENGHFWITTTGGIAQIVTDENTDFFSDEADFSIAVFDRRDGLQGREFNARSIFRTSNGYILMGGPHGFNMFHPDNIIRNETPPQVVFTGLHILNKPVKPNALFQNRKILSQSMVRTREITLKHSENIFSISFAALNFINPSGNRFAYRLKGFSNEWVYLSEDEPQRVTYTNLSPGNYVFHVKAANNDGLWNNEGVEIAIKVLPPFYRSRVAYILYAGLMLGLLWFSRYLIIQKERFEFEIENQKIEAKRQQELDRLKLRFLTNMSHEFRTPLSLMISPLRDMLMEEKDKQSREKFNLIYRNASRLLNMVNQLLDLRKIDVQGIKLNMTQNDIVKFVRIATLNFLDISERKNINLTFYADTEEHFMDFDRDKLEKIIFNLLSNAFKYTSDSGFIKVELLTKQQENEGEDHSSTEWVVIKITDNGIGIASEKQKLIFNRYYQDEDESGLFSAGTGIGLSLTQEFVKLHGGSICVESSPGEGSCFIIKLPGNPGITNNAEGSKAVRDNMQLVNPTLEKMSRGVNILPEKNTVLIVEDNEDFRFYLKDNLSMFFNIIEASSGIEGIELSTKYLPNVIVSDVMMKGMDGFELCEKIKKNTATANIPVILTTAQALENYRVAAYNIGADAYLVKPFAIEVLIARIENLIIQKGSLSFSWKTMVEQRAGKNPVSSIDEEFIKKAVDAIEGQLANSDFSVQDLSNALNISRVHLYKKLMALTGKSPIEFIRFIRLKKAAYLLKNSQMTVSEICYEVGYNTPKYFSSHFKKVYNVTPSEFKKINEKKTG